MLARRVGGFSLGGGADQRPERVVGGERLDGERCVIAARRQVMGGALRRDGTHERLEVGAMDTNAAPDPHSGQATSADVAAYGNGVDAEDLSGLRDGEVVHFCAL